MRKLILMRGLPGSGKTPAAKKLTEHLTPKDYRLFAADDYVYFLKEQFVFHSELAGPAYAVRALRTCMHWSLPTLMTSRPVVESATNT
jgi:tRNA uridine 5-carbamoylmethylation protein Kti12